MRRSALLWIAGSFLSSVSVASCAGEATLPDTERDAALTRIFNEGLVKSEIPGAMVGIWQEGKTPYVRAFGVQDKATKQPMTLDLNMRIGSVTKTFVTNAMLQLVDKGLIGLDDPISKHVSGVPNGENITMRMLAGMRSGLYSYTSTTIDQWPDKRQKQWTPQELLDIGLAGAVKFAPDAEFDYSNTNTVLIGLAIEKVSKKPLEAVLDELIIKPLKLSKTFLPTADQFPAPHSKGYGTFPPKVEVYETSTWNNSWGWAAGSMISTLQDVRVWTEALGKGTLLSPATKAERNKFREAEDEGVGVTYGLGVENDNGWLGHNGNTPGFITYAFYLPSEKITMVLMFNASLKLFDMAAMIKEVSKVISPNNIWPDPPKD
jgi:D-alanyl-D-alanine carboxypeptidase